MSSRGFRDQLGRGSMRSTAIIALVSTFLVMAGAVGLHRVTASRAVTKTAAGSALPARHLSTLPAGATSTNDGKIVGVVEGKFDAKTQQITILKSSSSDLKPTFKAFGRSDANTVLPDSSHTKAFVRSCANPNGSGNAAVNCLSTAPVNTVSGEMKITNTGTRKFYNTRLVFTDFLDQRGGIPVTANAYFNDGQVAANGKLGISRDYGDIDPSGGSQTRVWNFAFPGSSVQNFYFRYVIYADIGVATESVEPAAVTNSGPFTITISGQNFSTPTVELLNGAGASIATLSVQTSSSTSIVTGANGIAAGIYSVRVTNAGGTAGGPGSSTLVGRLTVTTTPDPGHTGTTISSSDAGPYRITGNATLPATLSPGTVIYVDDGFTLQVPNGLTANGGIPGVPTTLPAQIVFTYTPGSHGWSGIVATSSTGDVTFSNCVVENGGLAGGAGVNLSGSSRILRLNDSIVRRGAGHGIKATGIDDKFTGFTRSRIENNAGTAVLLSANAALGNGGGMGDLNGAGNTNVPDQKFYYSSANVIRGNGVNAIQIDATNNDFTKSGVLVGQGDIPIQILGAGGNPSVVGNATAPTGATLTIGPNAIVQLAAGMDLKAGDGTLFGNIDANGYGGYSHSQSPDTAISQRISFDKIAGGGNFGAIYFSTTSAGSSILNFVNVSNGGTSGSGSAQVIIDAINYSFDFTNSVSSNSSSYGLQFRSSNTVNRSGTTYSGNTTGTENIISAAVTIDTLAGGTYGSGNLGTQATVVRPIATAIDPGKGIYFIDQVGQPSSTPRMIRFLNTSGATLKIAGLSVPPNTVRNLSAGIYSGGNIDTSPAPADSPMDQVDFFKLSSLALSPNRNVLYLACTDSGVGAVFGLNVSPGTDSQTSPVTIGSGTAKTGNVNRVYLGDTTHLTDNLKGMAVDPSGNIYIADPGKWQVVSITPGGVWSQFAGKGTKPSPVTWQAFPGSSAATNFALFDPQGITVSSDGNTVYISDGSWSRVVRIQAGTANLVTQLGNFNAGVFDATTTPSPTGLALLGNSLYISNSGDHTVVSVDNPATVSAQTTPTGNATTINVPPVTVVGGLAGTSCSGSCGDGGVIGSAQFYLNSMYANLVSDGSGLFLADQGFNPGSFPQGGRIRYLNRSGAPATIAGTLILAGNINTIGGSGLAFPYNGGLANAAIFENNTSGVAIDANNNVWITEANVSSGSSLRFINRGNATITMLGQTVAPGAIIKVNRDGTDPVNDESTSPLNAYFYTLQGLTTTAQGVYVVDSLGKAVPSTGTSARKVSRVRFINTSAATVTVASVSVAAGEIKTIAGNSTVSATTGENILATDAKLLGVTDVAVNSSGDIYLSLSGDKKVRKITSGTGLINSLSVGSNSFTGLAFDGSGKLLIAVYDTNQVLRETAAGSGSFSSVPTGSATVTINKPRDIAVDSTGNIYVINGSVTVSQIIKIPTAGAATIFVGQSGTPGFGGDGELPGAANVKVDFGLNPSNMATFPGVTANMDLTVGIAINQTTGEIIFADANNYRVRRVK